MKPYSDAYFALIQAIPELGEPLGLGDKVLVFGRAVAIELAADGSERLSNAQVAEVLDTSVSAVETLLVRGKQNLRRALGEMADKDE